MAKFSSIAKGKRARKPIDFPLVGAKRAEGDTWTGETVKVDVRVLTPGEELDVLGRAVAAAKAQGVADPSDGDPSYDLALQIHTIALALIDNESPESAPAPFFDGGAEQILNSEDITREHIAFAYEHQQAWQAECSPTALTLSSADYMREVARSAGGDIRGFLAMSPAMRWSFTRSMASQLVTSLAGNSPSTVASPN